MRKIRKIESIEDVIGHTEVTFEEAKAEAERFSEATKARFLKEAAPTELPPEALALIEAVLKFGFMNGAGWMRHESNKRMSETADTLVQMLSANGAGGDEHDPSRQPN